MSTQVVEGAITQSALYKTTPDGTFCKLTVDADLWAGAGGFPVQLAMASDGVTVRAFLATVGNGMIIATDGTGTSCEGA